LLFFYIEVVRKSPPGFVDSDGTVTCEEMGASYDADDDDGDNCKSEPQPTRRKRAKRGRTNNRLFPPMTRSKTTALNRNMD
jgi:hypothetical protein